MQVLHSFPHKIGGGRICTVAWHQVDGAVDAGAEVISFPGVIQVPLRPEVTVKPTLARGSWRIPYRVLGRLRAFRIHDEVVARRLRKLKGEIDVVHAWPLAATRTLETAAELGIPTVLERPNAHTRFAYSVVRSECERIGVPLPPDQEHAYNEEILRREEEEYELADFLLCPSDFVAKTFLAQGFPPAKLLRHTYGYDPSRFYLPAEPRPHNDGLVVLFVGVAAVRKGLHFALEAWVSSPASDAGKFLIVGEFLPAYREYLARLLSHPSVEVLGPRDDVPELMRTSDALVLPTLEEGFPLVCLEAVASGCVLLVSDVCTNLCSDGYNGLVHRTGDVDELTAQITALHEDPTLLERLRDGAISTAPGATWEQAGRVLVDAYGQAIAKKQRAGLRDTAGMRPGTSRCEPRPTTFRDIGG